MITQIRNTLENARRHLKAMSYPVASDDCRIALENLDKLENRQKELVDMLTWAQRYVSDPWAQRYVSDFVNIEE